MKCKICQSDSNLLFRATVLQKYEVHYFQCTGCKFIQTEQPFWLAEAYAQPIADTDTGYVTRNIYYSEIVDSLISIAFHRNSAFLDFGGGYGLFVRLMRDKGIDFTRQDAYCENIFAKNHDLHEQQKEQFELLTAFEVFEHLENPMTELERMFSYADSVLFSTEILPRGEIKKVNDWWYFAPHTGQHIAFYSRRSLEILGQQFNRQLYTNGHNLHLLTNKKFVLNPVKLVSNYHNSINRILSRHFNRRGSLIQPDYDNALLKENRNGAVNSHSP
jgi:2-polyprenyl-3-methyl-5-hydroxy-6-metoxy-1,4-benzoquinol methylase